MNKHMKNTDPKSLDGFREAKREAQTKIAEVICRFEKEYRVQVEDIKLSKFTCCNDWDGEYHGHEIDLIVKL